MIQKIVRDLRMKKGYTSNGLSVQVGMNRTWVSQIETGKIKHPHLSSFKKMLSILGVSDEEIEKIILTEFPDTDKVTRARSSNKVDYRIEKKFIKSKRKSQVHSQDDSGKEEIEIKHEIKQVDDIPVQVRNLQTDVLTYQKYLHKCHEDSKRLFHELKQLPKPTLDNLLILLVDDL
jgi:transcriptional regulator with XRE-family HTH domain